MKWDPALKTIDPPKVVVSTQTISATQLQCFQGYRNLRIYHPGLLSLQANLKDSSGDTQILLDHFWKWTSQATPAQRGPSSITITSRSGEVSQAEAYCKITHAVDPIRWTKGKYSTVPTQQDEYDRYMKKLKEPMNQAYVEALTYYCVSKLRESGASPHFPFFYGSFTAVADTYRLNITDDFDSYKHTKWYWNGIDTHLFNLHIEDQMDSVSELNELTRRPSFLEDDNSSDGGDESEDEDEDEELENTSQEKKEDASIHLELIFGGYWRY